jgi:hypothetical protein
MTEPTKGGGDRHEEEERDVERLLRSGARLSNVFGRHVPRVFDGNGTLNDWPLFGAACLTRAHYALQSTMALRHRELDASVLTRVVYEHVVTFAWIAIDPASNLPRFLLTDLRERERATRDLESLGEDTTKGRATIEHLRGNVVDVEAEAPKVNQRAAAADAYWAGKLEGFEGGRTSFRGLYPALYRNFSWNTHPSIPGLNRFVSGSPGELLVGIPVGVGDHGVTLAPVLLAMGLLISNATLGWPPKGEVFAAFNERNEVNDG